MSERASDTPGAPVRRGRAPGLLGRAVRALGRGGAVADPLPARAVPPLDLAPPRDSVVTLPVALLVLGVLALARLLAIHVCHVYDDAFITFRYAVNLAGGHGLVWQPGERVLGTTAPGYAVLLAGCVAAGMDAVRSSLAIGVLADLGTAALLLFVLRERRLVATLAVLAFALTPQVARIGAGGMEMPLFAFVALAACALAERGLAARAGLCAAFATTLRPEAVLLVVVLFLVLPRGRRLRFAVPALVVGAAYAASLFAVYGSLVPQSVRAKAELHGGGWLDPWGEILRQAFAPGTGQILLLPLAAWGAARVLRRPGPLRSLSLYSLALVASYLVARPHTWGWYFYVPLVTWGVWVAFGAEAALARLGATRGRLERAAPFVGAPLAAAAVLLAAHGRRDLVSERVYGPMAAWAREARLADGETRVLASDIGALGYYGRGVVLDSEGLVWPAATGDRQMELVASELPEYLLLTAVRQKIEPLRADPELARRYVAVRRFSADGETDLDPPLDRLPVSWRQDYILYRRIF